MRSVIACPRKSESGFSLIEVLVAAGIFVVLLGIALQAIVTTQRALDHEALSGNSSAVALDAFASSLRDSAQTATGVSVPANLAAPGYGPVVLMMYVQDDSGTDWYVGYAQANGALYRLDYSGDFGGTPASVTKIDGVTSITARDLSPADLATSGISPYQPAMPVRSAPPGYEVPFAAAGASSPVSGGNHVVEVSLANASAVRLMHLAGGVKPSGFTIKGAPTVHAVVWREDQMHRDWLGLGQVTKGFVKGDVDVSYDGAKTWLNWCHAMPIYDNLGVGGGIFEGPPDYRINYNPTDPSEQAASLVKKCRDTQPAMPPAWASTSAPYSPPPITYDTPPPGATPPPCSKAPNSPYCVTPAPSK